MIKRVVCVVSFVALAFVGPAFSQCADPDNLLSSDHCGFDVAASVDEATGWWNMVPELAGDPLWGTVAHSATGGRTSAASMAGTSFDNGPPPMGWGSLLGARYCFPAMVSAGDVLGFGAWVNITTGAVTHCETVVFTSNAADCSGAVEQTFSSNASISGWSKVNSTDATLAATMAATHIELRVACYGMADFTVSIDDAYVGLNMVPVELQSFSIE